MSRENVRAKRVADTLKKELATIFQSKLKDPRVGLITIHEIKISRDLAYANVYVTAMSNSASAHAKECIELLNNASGFIRSELSSNVAMRKIPKLKFFYDEQLEYAEKMDALIQNALSSDEKNNG